MTTKSFFSKYKYLITILITVILSVAIDMITKVIAENSLQDVTINVIGSWLTFTFVTNPGAAFGSMEGANIFFFIATLIGVPLIVFLLAVNKKQSLFGNIGLALMLGGTIGNAIDRAFLGNGFFNGEVRDFIAVRGFAVFNIADSCLVVGVIIFIIAILFIDKDALFTKKEKKHESDA